MATAVTGQHAAEDARHRDCGSRGHGNYACDGSGAPLSFDRALQANCGPLGHVAPHDACGRTQDSFQVAGTQNAVILPPELHS
jgi:hypothetical protein